MSALELARFALYADLGVAFGVPAAALLTRVQAGELRPVVTVAVLAGLPLALIGYFLTVAEMAGTGLADLNWQMAGELATTTPVGWAFIARIAALGAAAAVCVAAPSRTGWMAAITALALASLAWSGHAAAGEGPLALPRLGVDIVHLLAAVTWFGALVLFQWQLRPRGAPPSGAVRSLIRFAGVGSGLVAAIVLTGIANLWFLTPLGTWADLLATGYGRVLAIKLALFAAMLALAASNRLVLVPALAKGNSARATRSLRLSIAAEFCAALLILLIVAHLGLTDSAAS